MENQIKITFSYYDHPSVRIGFINRAIRQFETRFLQKLGIQFELSPESSEFGENQYLIFNKSYEDLNQLWKSYQDRNQQSPAPSFILLLEK